MNTLIALATLAGIVQIDAIPTTPTVTEISGPGQILASTASDGYLRFSWLSTGYSDRLNSYEIDIHSPATGNPVLGRFYWEPIGGSQQMTFEYVAAGISKPLPSNLWPYPITDIIADGTYQLALRYTGHYNDANDTFLVRADPPAEPEPDSLYLASLGALGLLAIATRRAKGDEG